MKLKELLVKPRINKSNGQINISLPKKGLSLKELDKINSGKSIRILMEDL